jgi:hypothetical protein
MLEDDDIHPYLRLNLHESRSVPGYRILGFLLQHQRQLEGSIMPLPIRRFLLLHRDLLLQRLLPLKATATISETFHLRFTREVQGTQLTGEIS